MIDQNKIPCHIAIVMDGNGRWAKKRNLPHLAGHNAGMGAMKEIIKKSSALGVEHLTVYAFSTENWKRAADEVNGIFKLLVLYVDKELEELHENNVKVKILGDYRALPKFAVERIEKAVQRTQDNTGMQFNIALNYGGRDEVVRAVKDICEQIKDGSLLPEQVTEETISERLYTGKNFANVPDPDLVIRTSGEMRISNYLLWQSAYSEFVFTDVLWPDFTPLDLEKAIFEYQNRERRFGGR
ncbi:MAG: isoprenyl transferase [Clostridiales bacterium]|nr:isoprenyl transferase [Clostridiales bacterium]